ncbi:hypothetical protein HPB52_005463 [Rhipicephalus sanguineus]|uniref:Uncharacterized protein n=1 Tax=Rhipicephalus sanguineus TaxID=34632 RepID=A0A9D4T8M6_RHISA|nr:hypothetical protein HPB52_005463 [Rhipicephalus sanguineus]
MDQLRTKCRLIQNVITKGLSTLDTLLADGDIPAPFLIRLRDLGADHLCNKSTLLPQHIAWAIKGGPPGLPSDRQSLE